MQDAFSIRAGELIFLEILEGEVTSQIFGSLRQPSVCAGVGECAHVGALLPVGVLTNVVFVGAFVGLVRIASYLVAESFTGSFSWCSDISFGW